MGQSSGVLVFGVILIIVAVVIVGIFVVGLTRRTNKRPQTGETAGEKNIPRDRTMSDHPEEVQDTEGNFSRSATDTQDSQRNART